MCASPQAGTSSRVVWREARGSMGGMSVFVVAHGGVEGNLVIYLYG